MGVIDYTVAATNIKVACELCLYLLALFSFLTKYKIHLEPSWGTGILPNILSQCWDFFVVEAQESSYTGYIEQTFTNGSFLCSISIQMAKEDFRSFIYSAAPQETGVGCVEPTRYLSFTASSLLCSSVSTSASGREPGLNSGRSCKSASTSSLK